MVLYANTDFISFFPSMIIGIIIVISIIAITFNIKKGNKLKKVLENQAIKRNGEVINRFHGFAYPMLKFDYDFNEFMVYSVPGGKNHPPHTYVNVNLTYPVSHHMRLYKEYFASKIGKKLGTQDIEIGFDSFDNDIMVKGSDEYFVRSVLSYKVQDSVLKIIRNYKAGITLNKNKLLISVQRIVSEDFVYDDLIDTATAIVDQLKEIHHKF